VSAKGRTGLVVVAVLFAWSVPATAGAATVTLSPTADAFVRSDSPGTNFGGADFLDSHGGLGTSTCEPDGTPHVGPDYAYLKFDLSAIPPGVVVNSADLQLTSRTGFAWDGDPAQHIRFVGDDAWTEGGVTYSSQPTGIDTGDLASASIFYDFPECQDPKDVRQNSFKAAALTGKVSAERAGDGTLSLQVFNNNCTDCTVRPNGGYWVRFLSRETADPNQRPKLIVNYSVPAPDLYDAVPDSSGNTTVVGRAKGVPATPYTLRFYSSPSCTDGQLDGDDPPLLGTASVTPGASGSAYYARVLTNAPPPGSFVAATAETAGGVVSNLSRCVPAPDNDTWPRARPITSGADVDQSIDIDGQARWYRIDVQPNSNVSFDLTGLAANYDMYVFKDIAGELTGVSNTQELLQLSAEFAGEATAPSAFSPSAFSPSAFSPSAFSPSAFSPSAFSPSAFSPSAFSPSAFSPSAFSPSAFSPEAYSSAQVRSLIATSLNDGTGAESVRVNSWGNTRLYVMVTGRHGASSVDSPYHLHVEADGSTCAGVVPMGTAPADVPVGTTPLKTIILKDLPRMGLAQTNPLAAKLDALAARTEVAGKVVDLSAIPRIANLNLQADQHRDCPYAKNLLASAIKDVVDSYRQNPLQYVVVVGNDHAVPFFRYPDTSGLGPETGYVPPVKDDTASQASLRRGYVLSQDAYGSKTEISLKDSEFPVPDLAVGRVAETPAAITKVLDAYLATAAGVVPRPTSSLVTGYDFLTDAADAVQGDLSAGLGTGTGVRKDTLITNANVPPSDVGDPRTHSWDADRLRDKLFGSRHDLMFLAGHFSANNALAADYRTTVATQELADSTVDMTNSIVASAGCHSGYNLVDEDAIGGVTVPLDWAEAFAQKGATLIAGTGYQYGDTDFLEYSERLYSEFAHELRVGTGPVAVGRALVLAKQQYLAETPLMRGIHQKALLEATLYGLPMLGVDMPAGRIPDPTPGSIVSTTTPFGGDPGATLGLRFADLSIPTPTTDAPPKTLTNLGGGTTTATYLSGDDGTLTNPGEPALPVARKNVTVNGLVLRGVGFRGGDFRVPEPTGVTPLTGAATTEQQAVHTPFAPSVFFPSRLWSANYFDALSGGGTTSLTLLPAQYKADGPGSITDILRRYDNLKLRLYYSNETGTEGPNAPVLAGPPAIAKISDSVVGDTVSFRANVVGDPSAGIQEVWITYYGKTAGKWESLDLHQDADDSTLWTGSLSGVDPSAIHYVVQAVNGVGVTSLDDNLARYYTPGGTASANAPVQGSSLHLLSPPSGGAFLSSPSVTAQLLDDDGAPLAGRTITFTLGASSRSAATGSDGKATVSLPLSDLPDDYRLVASFAGDGAHAGSSDSVSGFGITRQATSLTLSPASSVLSETEAGPTATLTAGGAPLPNQTILFVLRKADGTAAGSFARMTDQNGKARIGIDGVPAGTFTVTAYFGGTVSNPSVALGDPTPYTTASATASVKVNVFSGFFSPVDNRPVVNQVNAGRAIPVKFSLGYNAGLGILAPGFPQIKPLACSATATVDPIETTVSVDSPTLSYDATSGQYTWVWKTPKDYAGSCKRLVLRFTNGSDHIADFKFTK